MVSIAAHEVEEGLEAYRSEFPDDHRREATLAEAIPSTSSMPSTGGRSGWRVPMLKETKPR